MLTAATNTAHGARPSGDVISAHKVLIVNGGPQTLELLETVLDAGHYDVIFVQSNQHAYSQIKHVRPDLVILCIGIEDVDGLQVLSMLKLDEETRGIPVVTYTTDEDEQAGNATPEVAEPEIFSQSRAELKN